MYRLIAITTQVHQHFQYIIVHLCTMWPHDDTAQWKHTFHSGRRGRDVKQFCNQWSKGGVLLFCINVRSVVRIKIVLVYCSNVGSERCIWWSCRRIRLDRWPGVAQYSTGLFVGCGAEELEADGVVDPRPRPRPRHRKTISMLSWGKTLSRDLTSLTQMSLVCCWCTLLYWVLCTVWLFFLCFKYELIIIAIIVNSKSPSF